MKYETYPDLLFEKAGAGQYEKLTIINITE